MSDADRCDNCGELWDEHPTVKANPSGWVYLCKPSVPRAARSVDDLRVGMVVTVHDKTYGWGTPQTVNQASINYVFKHSPNTVVILQDADPPAPPAADWLVPADTMEALREAMRLWDRGNSHRRALDNAKAARAVLDAATEVEHE